MPRGYSGRRRSSRGTAVPAGAADVAALRTDHMTTSLYDLTVPVFTRMLKNSRVWIDKAVEHAEKKKFDPGILMGMRLAPDMFPFSRQIQSSSDNAKGCVARLAGIEVPRYEDTEQTLAELQARIDKTVAFLDGIQAATLDGSEDREIVYNTGRHERRFKNGLEYVRTFALANFFFHTTTAYSILRHNGVELGKIDYLAGAG